MKGQVCQYNHEPCILFFSQKPCLKILYCFTIRTIVRRENNLLLFADYIIFIRFPHSVSPFKEMASVFMNMQQSLEYFILFCVKTELSAGIIELTSRSQLNNREINLCKSLQISSKREQCVKFAIKLKLNNLYYNSTNDISEIHWSK